MNSKNRLLLIKGCKSIFNEEIQAVISICAMHEVESVQVDLTKSEPIPSCSDNGEFSIVYLAGHGNFQAFGDMEKLDWNDFSAKLCAAACLKPSTTIFAACCEGGMRSVALSVFKNCPNVGYVVGPKSLVTQQTLALAFHCFLYNVIFRRGGVDLAVEQMCVSSGHIFLSHDLPTTYLENQKDRVNKITEVQQMSAESKTVK